MVHKCHGLHLSRGKPHKRVERLVWEVDHAESLLEDLGAVGRLEKDEELVAKLVGKLPELYEHEWWSWSSNREEEIVPGVNEWPVFKTWLSMKRKQAIRESLAHVSGGMTKTGDSSSAARPICGKCGAYGHKTNECTRPSTLSGVNVAQGQSAQSISKSRRRNPPNETYEQAAERVGKCPDCHVVHDYQRREGTGHHLWP